MGHYDKQWEAYFKELRDREKLKKEKKKEREKEKEESEVREIILSLIK